MASIVGGAAVTERPRDARREQPALRHGDIRIGISGWRYKGWRGVFYPKGLSGAKELGFAATSFRSVEINGTHYKLQKPEYFDRWAAETPEDFVFAVKAHRFITHLKRLKEVEEPLQRFFGSGVLRLGQKLGPVLWQLPARFAYDRERIETFFKLLPRDTQAAAALARRGRHIKRAAEPSGPPYRLRHAIEVRHESFVTPGFVELLRAYDVALVCSDGVDWPLVMDVTSDFVYCRLHGSEVLYASGYDQKAIRQWADRVVAWACGSQAASVRTIDRRTPAVVPRDVYVYFDNDAKVRAPFDAQQLIARVTDRLAKL